MLKIALVGQTNTGKTSVFNRLVTTTRTVISCEEHTTVDNQYGFYSSSNKNYVVVDTPGFSRLFYKEDVENLMVYDAILGAIFEADVLLFVLTQDIVLNKPLFSWYRLWLKKVKKPVIFLINKLDEVDFDFFTNCTTAHGIFFCGVSAKYGIGFPFLRKYLGKMDFVCNQEGSEYKVIRSYDFFVPRIRVALVGNENVGKSTLFNLLSKASRSTVSDKAGTTKECVYGPLVYKHLRFLFTDTVGAKLKSNTVVKFYDILIFVFDCNDFLQFTDKRTMKELFKQEKICVILFNKGDKLNKSVQKFTSVYTQRFSFLQNFLYIMCSAKYSFNIFYMYKVLNFMYIKNLFFYSSDVLTKILKDVTSGCFKVYFKKKNIVFFFAFSAKKTFSSLFIYGKNFTLLQKKHKKHIEAEISKRLGNFLFLTKCVFIQITKK